MMQSTTNRDPLAEHLSTLIDALTDAVYFKDGAGCWLIANTASLRILDLREHDWQGKTDLELAKALPHLTSVFITCHRNDERAWELGKRTTFLEQIPVPDGFRVLSVARTPLFNSDGSRRGLVSIAHDYTDRINAEPALAAANDTLLSVLNGMETIVYAVDIQTHKIIFVNHYAERSLNSQIKVGGVCWEELQFGRKGPCSFCNEHIPLDEDGKPTGGHTWEYQNTANHRWYHVQDYATRWIDGRLVRLEIAMDMTTTKEAEMALRESEARFRTIADAAPVIIWGADADSAGAYQGCTFFNQGWQSFTGSSDTPDYGFRWLAYVHPDDIDTCITGYLSSFREKQPFVMEYRLRHHEGEYRWIRDNGVPRFTEETDFLGFIGTCTDITEQKELEAFRLQRQVDVNHASRLSVAGEMASGLAHELSQPLSAANNYLQGCMGLIQSGQHDMALLSEAIKAAYTQTERAGKIISHLRSFIHKGSNNRQWVHMNQLAIGTIQFLDHEIQRHQIHVTFDFSDIPPIHASPIELEQILINLLKNAIDSMQTAPLRELGIKIRSLDASLEVEISDSGKGIPESEIDHVFNPFISSKTDGLGLGLTICHSILESYGGEIRVTSSPGTGSIFCFTLPFENHA